MAPSSSSTKKAAKLAKSGQGKKVRFQGGTLFPVVVTLVVVLGLALVVYSRQSRPSADASAPLVTDHWHHAYGFYLCDTWFQLDGDLEERNAAGTAFVNSDFQRTGIHSHNDGLIHWHPYSSAATGRRATLGLFLDNYGVELTNSELQFPENQRAGLPYQQDTGLFEEGETTCAIDGNDEDAELKVVVWNNYTDTDDGTTYIADFENIALNQDQMVVSIAFVPADTEVGMPPWAQELPELSAIDMGQLTPEDLLGNTGTADDGGGSAGTVAPSETAPGADVDTTDVATTDVATTDG